MIADDPSRGCEPDRRATWSVVTPGFLPFVLPASLERALRDAYATPPRAYHTFDHVEEVLAHCADVPAWSDPNAVAVAVLFHDAVYEIGRADNEERSASMARTLVCDLIPHVPVDFDRVDRLIGLTSRHGKLTVADVDDDEAHFLDADMAILGASAARYAVYEKQIAAEYASIDRETYRQGRGSFLRRLLERPYIYLSPHFHERLEMHARANIERALASLRDH